MGIAQPPDFSIILPAVPFALFGVMCTSSGKILPQITWDNPGAIPHPGNSASRLSGMDSWARSVVYFVRLTVLMILAERTSSCPNSRCRGLFLVESAAECAGKSRPGGRGRGGRHPGLARRRERPRWRAAPAAGGHGPAMACRISRWIRR